MSEESIGERIRRLYPELPPAERRAADVILTHLDALASYSATELAALAGVSKASVSRLMGRLGFHGAEQLRAHLRQQSAGAPAAGAAAGIAPLLEAELERISAVAAAAPVLDAAAPAIADARRVVVIGYRNSLPVALHLRQQLLSVREAVSLSPVAGQSLADELVGLTAEDVVIVIGFRRRPPIVERAIRLLIDSPARRLLIADPSARALAPLATWSIECPISGPGAFDSYGAAMFLISVLAGRVAEAIGPGAVARVEAIGSAYAELREIETLP